MLTCRRSLPATPHSSNREHAPAAPGVFTSRASSRSRNHKHLITTSNELFESARMKPNTNIPRSVPVARAGPIYSRTRFGCLRELSASPVRVGFMLHMLHRTAYVHPSDRVVRPMRISCCQLVRQQGRSFTEQQQNGERVC